MTILARHAWPASYYEHAYHINMHGYMVVRCQTASSSKQGPVTPCQGETRRSQLKSVHQPP